MCGIGGMVRFGESGIPAGAAGRMAGSMTHRGPDGRGFAVLGGDPGRCGFSAAEPDGDALRGAQAVFVHRRLAVIDLSDAGLQPMGNGDGTCWLVYNGEVYNYLELREELELRGVRFRTATDTEVVLRAYEQWGVGCLDRFNGQWAFAVWDTKRRELVLARDRFGIKPLYYATAGGLFAFASEPKALLALDGVSADPDEDALADYLVHSREDCFDFTFFRDITRLQPGEMMTVPFDGGAPERRRWWRLEDTFGEVPADDAGCAERFMELFESSVRYRLRSDVPVGTCLSGGLDSTAVVCTARPHLAEGNQQSFSAVYDPSFEGDESRYIDTCAEYAGIVNHRVTPSAESLWEDIDAFIRCQDEPFGSTSQYAQYTVFRTAREHGVTVTLDGQGADEALAGYYYIHPAHIAGLLERGRIGGALSELAAYRRNAKLGYADAVLATMSGFLSHRAMLRWSARYSPGRTVDWVTPRIRKRAGTIRAPEPPSTMERLDRRLYELFMVSSLPALLRYEDRNAMAFSVEARLPFMDHRLVSYLFSLPAEQKIRDGMTKMVMRNALRGRIPEVIRTRTDKIGFATPEAGWFRGALYPRIRDVLFAEKTRKRGLYDIPRLERLVEGHRAGAFNADRAVWRALNCELWLRAFCD